MVNKILEGSILLIMIYLVLSNASGFSNAIRAVGGVYTSSVKALQGR